MQNYIKSKLVKEIEKLEKALSKAKDPEEITAIEEKLAALNRDLGSQTVLPDATDRITVFARSPEGYLCLLNYQILGYYKETAQNFLESGMKNKFSRYVDVRATMGTRYREVYLLRDDKPLTEPDGILERPLRAFVSGQYIVSIAGSEMVKPPVTIEFYTVVLGPKQKHGITLDTIRTLLEIGREKGGISQWRNAGFGKFELIELKQLQ